MMSRYTQNARVERLEDGLYYIGGFADLQGLWATGNTEDEAWDEFVSVVRDAALVEPIDP